MTERIVTGLKGKTVFITGASRGIGREIALRCARDGANVVITAKTAGPHPRLPGTIHSVAQEVEAAGGRALPIRLDVRDEGAVQEALREAAEAFGGIDILERAGQLRRKVIMVDDFPRDLGKTEIFQTTQPVTFEALRAAARS